MVLPKFVVAFCTVPAGEAKGPARARPGAGVSVTGIQSFYRREGTA